MKISYNEACGRDCSSLETDLRLCEAAGFDYIEIRLDLLSRYLWTHTLGELKAWFSAHHLKPHALNAVYLREGFLGPAVPPQENEALLEQFLFAAYTAQELGAGAIILVPPFSPDGGPWRTPQAETEADCARMLKQLGALAAERDVKLCFEIVGLQKSAARTISAARRIVEAVDLPNVGYVVDSYNLYLCGRLNDFSQMAELGREKIFAAHINNADDVPESEMGQHCRRFPDSGVVDLKNYLGVLRDMGYDGMLSVETFRPEYWQQTPERVIGEAWRTTSALMRACGCWEGEEKAQ